MGAPKRTDTAAPPTTPEEVVGDATRSYITFLENIPAEAVIRTGVNRLNSYLHPHIGRAESLQGVPFNEDLDVMKEDIRRRYGPGQYRLYVRTLLPDGKARATSVDFMLGDGGEPLASADSPPAPAGADTLADARARVASAISARAEVAELRNLESLSSGPARNPLEETKQLAEILRSLQPQTDPITMLKNARDLLAPAPAVSMSEQLGMVEKLAGIVSAFGGGSGGERGGSSGWDFAIELVRQIGPNLGQVIGLATEILSRTKGQPAPMPATPAPDPQPNTAAVPEAPPRPAVGPANAAQTQGITPALGPDSQALMEAVGNDPHKAARLKMFLDTCALEMAQPADTWEDSWARAEDFAATHVAGFADQLRAATAEQAWQLWMLLDSRTLNMVQAGPWVRGFVEYLKLPEEGTP